MITLNHLKIKSQEELNSHLDKNDTENCSILCLIRNYIDDFSILSITSLNLINLQEIYLGANELNKIPDFSLAPNLKIIHLNNNKISDLSNLSTITQIEQLDLRSNRISSLSTFISLENLKWLSLSSNLLTNLKHIPHFPNLKYLGLFANFLGENCLSLELDFIQASCPLISNVFIKGNQYLEREVNELFQARELFSVPSPTPDLLIRN